FSYVLLRLSKLGMQRNAAPYKLNPVISTTIAILINIYKIMMDSCSLYFNQLLYQLIYCYSLDMTCKK
ncbi:hypothetical protein, partial [Staphylococcus aureus]|uniref:hypothetical protein n=1 Tax=Staphylococcus aureus TaxID=1280 RepID=UPI003EE1627A